MPGWRLTDSNISEAEAELSNSSCGLTIDQEDDLLFILATMACFRKDLRRMLLTPYLKSISKDQLFNTFPNMFRRHCKFHFHFPCLFQKFFWQLYVII